MCSAVDHATGNNGPAKIRSGWASLDSHPSVLAGALEILLDTLPRTLGSELPILPETSIPEIVN